MNNTEHLSEQSRKIVEGLKVAYQKLIEFKKSKNSPFVVSENGTIKHISPHEVKEETV